MLILCSGCRQSPEGLFTFYDLAKEFIQGDTSDETNPLRWDCVRLNLIGNQDFGPSSSNIFKWDSVNMRIAGYPISYVDDLRAVGFPWEHAWQIARRIASYLQYLGI